METLTILFLSFSSPFREIWWRGEAVDVILFLLSRGHDRVASQPCRRWHASAPITTNLHTNLCRAIVLSRLRLIASLPSGSAGLHYIKASNHFRLPRVLLLLLHFFRAHFFLADAAMKLTRHLTSHYPDST